MKRLICLAICLCCAVAFAQKAPTEVSLVVSADGPSKTEAVNNALRSAIEQSFGTFVSANTEILNDELVKDEIATVSSGNIQNYSEVASVSLPNGNTSVTLNVTVSLSKLVSYAQSKGSQCEIAGATFGANRRLYEFNKKNEQIAIQNMIKQLDALRPIYDYEITVSEPLISKSGRTASVEIGVKALRNEKTDIFSGIVKNTLLSLAMNEEQVKPLQQSGFTFEKCNLVFADFREENPELTAKIREVELFGDENREALIELKEMMAKENEKWYYEEMNNMFFYNENFLSFFGSFFWDCLYDFQLLDNLTNVYFISRYRSLGRDNYAINSRNGHVGAIKYDNSDAPYELPDGSYGRVKYKTFLYYINNIPLGKYTFQIPIESIEKISNIKITPSKQASSTNFIEIEDENNMSSEFIEYAKKYGFFSIMSTRNADNEYRGWLDFKEDESEYVDDYISAFFPESFLNYSSNLRSRSVVIFIKNNYNDPNDAIKEINSQKKQY